MFHSSALFAAINCPFSTRGLCERPHCLYKHVKECRVMSGASNKSSIVDLAGVQNGRPYANTGAPVIDVMKDECLQELERINKEIESVRHEVELEQRRLSVYQTVQADDGNAAFNVKVSESETAGISLAGGSYGCPSHTNIAKTHSRASLYVVDNSKPRTDLEYDPLSNFSADLRSYSSSGKEHGVKKGQGLKMARNTVPCNHKTSVTDQAQLSQVPLDSYEDDVLIIDIPPSPGKNMARDQKPLGSPKDKEELKEFKMMSSLLNSPPLHIAEDAFPPASMVQENGVYSDCAQNNRGQSNFYENKKCENIPADGSVVDFSGCVANLQRDAQKMTCFQMAENEAENSLKPASPAITITHQRGKNWNSLVVERIENAFLAALPRCDLIRGVGKMNPPQISNHPPSNSLFSKVVAADSDTQCRQQEKQARTAEPPVQNLLSNQCSSANAPPVRPHIQKTSSKIPEQTQGNAAVNHAQPESHPDPASGSTRALAASSLTHRAEPSFTSSAEQHLEPVDKEVIIIDSSSEDELNYSDMELSDSDPMEECFRIFMEGNDVQPDVPVGCMDVEKPELKVKAHELSRKKRVAHEAKHTEQPLAKSRPQPQVLVPLRVPAVSGFSSQPSITSKIQQVQQRASMMTASVRGGQALISSTCQRRPDTRGTPAPSAQAPAILTAAPVQNACVNRIPLGASVIEVGNNLHLILPGGVFPLPATSGSSPATPLLTRISHVQTSAVTVRQTYHPPAVVPVQRYRTCVPLIIPAPARKPAATSASAHSSPAPSAATPSTVTATVKPAATKRKTKQPYEAIKEKVPHDIRQRYVNMFTEEFLKTSANVNDAFEKALAEERTVYNRSVNKLKYLSIAVNALKRLKNQSAVAAKDQNEVNSKRLKGNIPLNLTKSKGNDDMSFYESLRDYVLTEDRLIESNYPLQHPEKPSGAILFADNKKCNTDPLKRICCRCGATYSVSLIGKHVRKEECNYHYGKGVKNRVPGGVETRYSCCEGVMGAPGCQVFKLHVHDSLGLDGFASTVPRHPSDTSCPGVYSLDCEMCFTIHGLELSRVTLVNSSLQVVYDTFVTPDNEVIDYNTRFSGISQDDVKDNRTSLREVQEALLSCVSSDTLLIGHGLETDLCALKLLHGKVVDTSVVFPHRLGPPHKLTLNRLTAEYLRRIIQESVCGHDTAEDATACMELMLWKVKEDGKLKK